MRTPFVVFLVSACCFRGFESFGSNSSIPEQWSLIGSKLQNVIWPHNEDIVKIIRQIVKDPNSGLPEECAKSLLVTGNALQKRKGWAFKILDSWSKFQPGFLSSQFADLGNYDQCLDTNVNEDGTQFIGQYCLFRIHFPLPPRDGHSDKNIPTKIDLRGTQMEGSWLQETYASPDYKYFYHETINNAICIPSTCSSSAIEREIQRYLTGIPVQIKFWASCDTRDTYKKSYPDFLLYKQVSILALLLITLTVVVSTLWSHLAPDEMPHYLKHFSAIENTRPLFYSPKADDPLAFITGVRVFMLCNATFIHISIGGSIWSPVLYASHNDYAKKPVTWFWDGFYSNLMSGMCINFILGGMLAYTVWFPIIIRMKGKVNLFTYIIGRWLRTVPVAIGVILLVLAFPITLGSGPIFQSSLERLATNCLKNGWTELLFLENQNGTFEMCLPHGWLGFAVMGIVASGGLLLRPLVIYMYELAAFVNPSVTDGRRMILSMNTIYLYTYNHIPAYIAGLCLGHLSYHKMALKNWNLRMFGWICVTILWSSLLYVPYYWRVNSPTRSEELVFSVLQPTIQILFFGWIFYSCSTGNGGIINWMFGNRLVAISRFSYSTFMIHFGVIWYDSFTSRHPMEVRTFVLLTKVAYTLVFSTILGYLVYLLFEAPSVSLQKAAFKQQIREMLGKDGVRINIHNNNEETEVQGFKKD